MASGADAAAATRPNPDLLAPPACRAGLHEWLTLTALLPAGAPAAALGDPRAAAEVVRRICPSSWPRSADGEIVAAARLIASPELEHAAAGGVLPPPEEDTVTSVWRRVLRYALRCEDRLKHLRAIVLLPGALQDALASAVLSAEAELDGTAAATASSAVAGGGAAAATGCNAAASSSAAPASLSSWAPAPRGRENLQPAPSQQAAGGGCSGTPSKGGPGGSGGAGGTGPSRAFGRPLRSSNANMAASPPPPRGSSAHWAAPTKAAERRSRHGPGGSPAAPAPAPVKLRVREDCNQQ